MPHIITKPSSQKQPTTYVGIDPGVSGGVAVLWCEGTIHLHKTPETPLEMWKILTTVRGATKLMNGPHAILACMEQLTGWTGSYNRKDDEEAHRTNPGSSMFQLGKRVGWVEMALAGLGFAWEAVPPAAWQRGLGIERDGEVGPEWKRRLKEEAKRLFPNLKITLSTCDALLIAEFCRRKYG